MTKATKNAADSRKCFEVDALGNIKKKYSYDVDSYNGQKIFDIDVVYTIQMV